MEDDEKNVNVEESSDDLDSGSDEGIEGAETVSEADLKALLEKSEAERRELASLVGRQGQELGELRKAVESTKAPQDQEKLYENFFDDESTKAISFIVDAEVEKRMAANKAADDEKRLKIEFGQVYSEYDVSEENLTDLAYYASVKGVSLAEAANQLSQKGLIEKRVKGTGGNDRTGGNLTKAPKGGPKIGGGKPGSGKSPAKMTQEEWNALSDEQREDYQKQYSPA